MGAGTEIWAPYITAQDKIISWVGGQRLTGELVFAPDTTDKNEVTSIEG